MTWGYMSRSGTVTPSGYEMWNNDFFANNLRIIDPKIMEVVSLDSVTLTESTIFLDCL